MVIKMDYRDYQPKKTSRVREDIEWSVNYSYNTLDTKNPRVMLIGDSICNAYHYAVRDRLADKANVSYWASSKCVTDPDYFRELDFMLDAREYALVTFNNGLHSLTTDLAEWEEAYRAAVRFILDKLPETTLCIVLSTALNDDELTKRSRELNQIALRIADEFRLPVIDLFTPTNTLDKPNEMTDRLHFEQKASKMQADMIAAKACELLNLRDIGIVQKSTETGALGAEK